MTTVRELENQLKVSKVSIYSMLKKPEFKPYVFKGEHNLTLINEIGVELLKAHFLREKGKTLRDIATDEMNHNKKDSNEINKESEEPKNADIISILQQQLETKDDQINSLLSIVSNQQRLQATQLLTDSQNVVNDGEKPKKNFFKRIFKKKQH